MLEDWRIAARESRLLMAMEQKSVCPVFTLEGRSAEEVEASLSKSARQRVKRARKRLMQEKDVQIVHEVPGPEHLLARLEELRDVENRSWKGEEGVGVFSEGASWDFFRTLSPRLAERGQLDLGEIRIDGQLVSYRYGLRYRGVFLDYNLAFLPEYYKLGLGRILLDDLVADCAKKGYRAMDASRVGRHSQHLLFERADTLIHHWHLRWYNASVRGRAIWFLNEVLKMNAKRMRKLWREWKQGRAAAAPEKAGEGQASE